MKAFFKFVFASCLGTILALVAIIFLFGIFGAAIGGMSGGSEKISSNSVLTLDFEDVIPEKTNNVPINPYEFKTRKVIGLRDIIRSIDAAAGDDKVKGILVKSEDMNIGFATSYTIRQALERFKESDKFVISYGRYFSEGAYHMASVADEVYMNPLGMVLFDGFAAQIPFYKDMLDRIGVKMNVYYAGQFKSATEPVRRNDMSDQNRLQVKEYLNGLYDVFLDDISKSRDLTRNQLLKIANNLSVRSAKDAVQYKLIDGLKYGDEIETLLKEKLGLEEKEKIKYVGINKYFEQKTFAKEYSAKDQIVIIYAEGTIVDGEGENGSVGGDKYVKLIRKIRKKDEVKAIVLRINSPGGSAIASDMIWRELKMAKEDGIKIVVSMGDYAASGGYYIACMADSIFAEANTLTGSIGVFKTLPNMDVLFNKHLGIHWDSVKTTRHANGINTFFPTDPEIAAFLQEDTDNFYEVFLDRVGEGRGMSRDETHEIAQGRVWTGAKASNIGLVDKIGNLEDALRSAATMAGLDKYKIKEYPIVKEPIEQLIDEILNSNKDACIRRILENEFPQVKYINDVRQMKGVQARLPFVLEVK